MKPLKLSLMIKGAIIVFGLCGLLICALWYPFSISLFVFGVVDAVPTFEQNVSMWTQLIFYWGVSVPCFVILALAWKTTNSIRKDEFFSYKTAKTIKRCAVILFVDVLIFFIGNTVLLLLDLNAFVTIYYVIAVVGLAVASIFTAMSHFVSKAAQLKEETEGLI